jgi:hypothetical protein
MGPLLEQIIDCLAIDWELLEEFDYFTLEQACTKICDLIEASACDDEHFSHLRSFGRPVLRITA